MEWALNGSAERQIIATYLLYYIIPNPKYADLTLTSLNRIVDHAVEGLLKDTVMWTDDLKATMDHNELSQRNPFVDHIVTKRDFNSVVRLVEEFGEKHGQFQNLVCREMKN